MTLAVSLPCIPLVDTPAQTKVYPDAYIVAIRVATRDPEGRKQNLTLGFRPFCEGTWELYPNADRDFYFTIDDLWAEAERVPKVGEAMVGICTLAGLLLREKKLLAQLAVASEEDRPAIQTQLDTVRTDLGITS